MRPGFLVFRVGGKKVRKWFAHEAGGHRWQRIPPTEKRGRVHTSTVTVVVLDVPKQATVKLNPRDLDIRYTKGSGPGGQHRNKTATTVQIRHLPSGLTVRVDAGRSQTDNRERGLALLQARLLARERHTARSNREQTRRRQAGSGMRGDKVRTIQVRNDVVIDHRRSTRMSYRRYARGMLGELARE